MLNYKDFLFESMINESIVVFGKQFQKLLSKIDSPISTALLDMESKDLNVTNNYIDIDASDKEKITFIPDRRAQEILNPKENIKVTYNGNGGFLKHAEGNAELFSMLEYTPVGDKCYHPSDGEVGELLKLAVSPSSGNTYLKVQFPGGLTVINKNGVSSQDLTKLPFSQNRQSIRIGRGIRGLLNTVGAKFSDSEIEKFVNLYKSQYDKMNDVFSRFEIVTGDDIAYWYYYKNYLYERNRGQLSNSCMSGVPNTYFEIYTKNPKCRLVILKAESNEAKIVGRALLWNLDSPEGFVFMDRIYTHNDSDIELFKEFAKHNGWYVKKYQRSSEETDLISPDGSIISPPVLRVKLIKGRYSKYPYLDTLKYLTEDGYLDTNDDKAGSITLEDTSGSYVGGECERCDGSGRVDCSDCDGDGRVECGRCDGDGEVECGECDGEGKVDCSTCDGEGEVDGEKCEDCNGKGKVECEECDGDGTNECGRCEGRGTEECEECS